MLCANAGSHWISPLTYRVGCCHSNEFTSPCDPFSSGLLSTDDREAAGHGERGHVQDRGAGEAADAKEQGA